MCQGRKAGSKTGSIRNRLSGLRKYGVRIGIIRNQEAKDGEHNSEKEITVFWHLATSSINEVIAALKIETSSDTSRSGKRREGNGIY